MADALTPDQRRAYEAGFDLAMAAHKRFVASVPKPKPSA